LQGKQHLITKIRCGTRTMMFSFNRHYIY